MISFGEFKEADKNKLAGLFDREKIKYEVEDFSPMIFLEILFFLTPLFFWRDSYKIYINQEDRNKAKEIVKNQKIKRIKFTPVWIWNISLVVAIIIIIVII